MRATAITTAASTGHPAYSQSMPCAAQSAAEARRRAADDATCGRGLLVLDALADRWGTEPLPWEKQAWAELVREGTAS